ncbi:acetamidase [Aerococcus urinaehominis]|uniref:Acetamidase n=1 Tax=Aerococcus urinaehominis TaxID=128944 RepID=A0A0X8FJS0_9LACT|nr:acetamidase/formamidase family protein [Aerococcus urinaehominis]AMB98609.1 acetamidase [Aerococcus urinaehominis]SDL95111.1 amidase [Aerococcus urinaehominis]
MIKINRDQFVFAMDKNNPPAAQAKSGDQVVFDLMDCFSDTVKSEADTISEIDFNKINPATGPLYVEEAEVGDVLKVTIEDIKLDPQGAVMSAPGLNKYFSNNITKEQTVICPIDDAAGTFEFQGVTLPLNKHIGVIGTAPAGEAVTTGTPRMHGGNMDNTKIAPGSILYLPVNTPGALLAMGDMHASMGDGEVWGSGVEVGGQVTVTVEVLKDSHMPTPFVETADAYYAFGAADNMEEAVTLASDNLHQFIMDEAGLDFNQAGMLMTIKANLAPCQIVNPDASFRFGIAKDILEAAKGFKG